MIGSGLGGNFPRGKSPGKKGNLVPGIIVQVDPIIAGKNSVRSHPQAAEQATPESQSQPSAPVPLPQSKTGFPMPIASTEVQVHPVIARQNGPTELSINESASVKKAKQDFKRGIISVGVVGQLLDNCGYGEAARNYVSALHAAGVEVNSYAVTGTQDRPDFGEAGRQAARSLTNKVPYAIKIVILIPTSFKQHHEPGVYKIGLFYWETDRLPVEWVNACNGMDEIWVSCNWTADVAKTSGVYKPIYVFPNCLRQEDYVPDGPVASFSKVDSKVFKFLSIFQWTPRKNPEGLIRAYLRAFSKVDRTILILKTYLFHPGDVKDQNEIVSRIRSIIENEKGTAPIYAITKSLSQKEMIMLHRTCDAFALIHRAEGFGLPLLEASAMGKPVISTRYSAPLEFLSEQSSYFVRQNITPVRGMKSASFRCYEEFMNWAEPDVEHCAEQMRHVYEHRDEAKRKGLSARKSILENYSWYIVGKQMRDRLADIGRLIT